MKPLAITLGDPAGIGPEVVIRALQQTARRDWIAFGSWELTEQTLARLAVDSPFANRVRTIDDAGTGSFVDVGADSDGALRFGSIDRSYGAVALTAVERATAACLTGHCSALVTAPLSKEAVALSRPGFRGHTELLAEMSGRTTYGRDFAMYFDSPRLRVVLLTVHEPLSKAITMITPRGIDYIAHLLSREYARLYGSSPRIGVAGLNPHAGESGMLGSEEQAIAEGVELAANEGLSISGPHAADMIFKRAIDGAFDAVIALYHDQGLIPIKTLDFEQSVNVTIGLPFLRASVDHGTAFDIAGRGIADAAPMRYAIEWAFRNGERYRSG